MRVDLLIRWNKRFKMESKRQIKYGHHCQKKNSSLLHKSHIFMLHINFKVGDLRQVGTGTQFQYVHIVKHISPVVAAQDVQPRVVQYRGMVASGTGCSSVNLSRLPAHGHCTNVRWDLAGGCVWLDCTYLDSITTHHWNTCCRHGRQ